MLLNELKMSVLNVNAESVLPVVKTLNIEGRELNFKITAFQSGYGSGKKSVISGTISLNDANHTSTELINSDIESIRRKVAKLIGLKNTSERKPRAVKERTKVEELKNILAVARRVRSSCNWIDINTKNLRTAFKAARETDRERAKEALKEKAVSPLLAKIEKLSPEERALLLASLQ